MKITTENLGVKISRQELEVMTKEVKEILAFKYITKEKKFGFVDLWNIHRHRKSMTARRNYV